MITISTCKSYSHFMKQKDKQFLGWIALDMDGTITLDKYSVPEPVVTYLRQRVNDGWKIAIATGRPFKLAQMALKTFDFPYIILPQNGTAALQMPSKIELFRRYIPVTHLAEIDAAFEGTPGDYIVFNGYDHGDQLYWRPNRMDEEQTFYVENIAKSHGEIPIAVVSFQGLKESSIPIVKCFGTLTDMTRVTNNLKNNEHFNLTLIRDPYAEDYYILLITDRSASKGQSLLAAIDILGWKGTIIAAGDDENDKSLLEVADIKIAMAHAPEHLHNVADFIAPPTHEFGIIQALELALRKNGKDH